MMASMLSACMVRVQAQLQRLLVLGDVGSHGIESGDVRLLEGHRRRSSESHDPHHKVVLGHFYQAPHFAFFVPVFNGHKIAPVKCERTFQVVEGAQERLLHLAERLGARQRVRHQHVAVQLYEGTRR